MSSSIAFSDVNGDDQPDVLITGGDINVNRIAKLYIQDENPNSTDNIIFGNGLDIIPYPNPSKTSTLFLSYYGTTVDEVSIKVYDTKGELMHQQIELSVIGQQTFSINIDSLIAGTYFIELVNSKRKGVAKFIVL